MTNQPNYNSDVNHVLNNANSSNWGSDATQHLDWDSAWQPDRDEDYAAVVQEYRRPQVLPQPSAPNYSLPTFNVPPAPAASVTLYHSGEEMTQLKDEVLKNQSPYESSEPSSQTYARQPVTTLPHRSSLKRWLVELVVFMMVFGLLSSWGWWPFWLFIFWPWFGGGRNSCQEPSRSG